jgi:hypothetical protein
MGFEGQYGRSLGCVVLLAASCTCFQARFPVASRRFGSYSTLTAPWSSPQGATSIRQSQAFNVIPLTPASSAAGTMSNETIHTTASTSMKTSSSANGIFYKRELTMNDPYPLGISKHYFEFLEEQSGKDYRWIKPLKKTPGISQLML